MNYPYNKDTHEYLLKKQEAANAKAQELPALATFASETISLYSDIVGIERHFNHLRTRTKSVSELIDYLSADKINASLFTLNCIKDAIGALQFFEARQQKRKRQKTGDIQLTLFPV